MQVVAERRGFRMHGREHQSLLGVKFETQGRRRASFLIPPECRCILVDGIRVQRDDEHPSLRGIGPCALLGVVPRHARRHVAIDLGRPPLDVAQPIVALQGRCGWFACGEESFGQMETIGVGERKG